MENLSVKSSTNSYQIVIGDRIRFQLAEYLNKAYSSILIVSDENVATLYMNDVKRSFPDQIVHQSVIPSGESSKSMEHFYQLQTDAIRAGLDRESLIIALGGGVVGDLAGFVASTFMRGIDYVQVPTTILAHDSSVGGKVAINHELGKNLIGSFYPPRAVVYDVDTLGSLNRREIRSGYAELIKEALIADREFFQELLKTDIYRLSSQQLQDHLKAGIKIKAAIVEDDEREAGIRKYLNLGHTLGHALEAELGYGALSHGEAVAVGLLFALHVSEKKHSVQMPFFELREWMDRNLFPYKGLEFNAESLLGKMKSDKKTVNKRIQMVLLTSIAAPKTADMEDEEIRDLIISFGEKLVKN